MKELISVIIPIFNIEDYIGKCIESVVSQTYTNMEIILVDDGSTDNSGEICKQYAYRDSRIKCVYQENEGSVGARKTGLTNATGKYIVFVDGDDYVEKDYVKKLYELMIDNDVDMVHSNYIVDCKEQRYIKNVHLFKEKDLDFEFRKALLRDYVFEWNSEKEIIECNLYGCIYKKNVIYDCYMELPNYQQYGEDLLCLCNLIMRCQSIMLIPDAYYHYVMREGSLDHTENFMKALLNKASLYKEVEKILERYEIFSELFDKCQTFFVYKVFRDFSLFPLENVQVKPQFVCSFIDLLLNKKIVLYGAGMVGQSIYEQLTNYESIEIVGWFDRNYRKVQLPYKRIENPALVNLMKFDYIIVAVKEKSIAEEIIDYLSDMNIDRKLILWEPYLCSESISLLVS